VCFIPTKLLNNNGPHLGGDAFNVVGLLIHRSLQRLQNLQPTTQTAASVSQSMAAPVRRRREQGRFFLQAV